MTDSNDPPAPAEQLPRRDRAGQIFQVFLIVSVCVLCVLVVLLVRQNRQLRVQLDFKKRVEESTATQSLAIGETVEPLTVITPDGAEKQLKFGELEPATLVLFVAEHCGYCEKAIPLWSAALRDSKDSLAKAKGPGVRIVGIVADASEEAAPKPIAPEIPTFRVKNGPKTWLIRVNATPSAVLLSPAGKVEDFWIGETNASQVEELRSAILAAAAR